MGTSARRTPSGISPTKGLSPPILARWSNPAELKRWVTLQRLYEGLSRVNRVPLIGPWLWRTYDRLQAIHPHYPFRGLSKPSLGSMRLNRLILRGFGRSIVEHTRGREDLPLLTTFFAVALAADHQGRSDVYCVVTDTDVNRIWVARTPEKGRIHYLAQLLSLASVYCNTACRRNASI